MRFAVPSIGAAARNVGRSASAWESNSGLDSLSPMGWRKVLVVMYSVMVSRPGKMPGATSCEIRAERWAGTRDYVDGGNLACEPGWPRWASRTGAKCGISEGNRSSMRLMIAGHTVVINGMVVVLRAACKGAT